MPFSIDDCKPYVLEAAHKNVSASSGSVTDVSARRWLERAIRYMQRFDFECWRNEFTLTLTAEDYHYLYTDAVWTGGAAPPPTPPRGAPPGGGGGFSPRAQQPPLF